MKKSYDDDDGRSFADMSDVPVRTPFGFISARGKTPRRSENAASDGADIGREARRSYIFGALSAALLIALAFIVGLGAVIAVMVLLFS